MPYWITVKLKNVKMKQQIDNTVEKLKTDPFWGVSVVDKDTLKNVERNATGEELSQKYGSVEGFFEHLKDNGITRLQIYDRRKNGSAWRSLTDYAVTFVEKQAEPEPVPAPEPIAPAPIHRAAPMRNQNFGLNGLMGLSMPEAIFKTQDHARMQSEYIEMKAENKALQKEVEKLKEENLRNEILGTKSVETKNANAEMVKTLSESPVLAALASRFMPTGTPPGLGMPDASLSPVKQQMIASMQHADDSFVSDLFSVARGMSESEAFDAELTELLKKYNLTHE